MKQFDVKGVLLVNPGKSDFKFNAGGKDKSPGGKVKKPEDNKEAGSNINNPNGGLLSTADKRKIIDLKCDTKLINPSAAQPYYGPDYPTNTPNFLSVLARCPANCHKNFSEKIVGVGLHPNTAPICMAALVDNSISYYGGIVSISILPGLTKYTVPKSFKKKWR
jgi:hypothetical protein